MKLCILGLFLVLLVVQSHTKAGVGEISISSENGRKVFAVTKKTNDKPKILDDTELSQAIDSLLQKNIGYNYTPRNNQTSWRYNTSTFATSDEPYTCIQHFYNYGLTTNAQLHCGFSQYNDAVIDFSAQCYAKAEIVGMTDILEKALEKGLKDFDDQYHEAKDKKAICRAVQEDFDDFIRD